MSNILLTTYSTVDKRIIASAIIGNLLENFDVMICAFLAQFIAITFFPTNSITNNIFYTFSIFFVGYLSRPIGSLIIGLYADQIGRKKLLVFTIAMVGISTAIIGITPSYQSIGITATVLFSLFRIMQNISVGGEYIGSISYLIESAKKNKKGFYGCWVSVGANCGTLCASFLVFILTYLINIHLVPTWSWRIIFILAAFGTLFGIWIRRALPESLGFILANCATEPQKKTEILKESINLIKTYPIRCLAISAITWLGVTQTIAIFVYSPIHMTIINHFTQTEALGLNTIALFFLILFVPIFGWLSDYYNKINFLIMASLSFLILSLPYFWMLSYGTYTQILIFKLLFCIPSACFYAIAPVLITENFPVKLRCTSLALIYQVTASLAAGLTPLAMLYILHHSQHNFYSPAYFLIASIFFCLYGLYILNKDLAKLTISRIPVLHQVK